MSKATESKLSALHSAVAVVLTDQLLQKEAKTDFDVDGNIVETGEEMFNASPATISAAIKFLKDNNITCDIEENKDMSNLREALSKKQRHSRLSDPEAAGLKVVK